MYMTLISEDTEKRRLASLRELDPVKTFECGQCFRWNCDADGAYWGAAKGEAAKISVEGDEVYITCRGGSFDSLWRDYFDLDTDYDLICGGFDAGEYLQECAEYGAGIRILRQDAWEALCSFIISQCNNIPRIKKIVETLCSRFGGRTKLLGREFSLFPDADTLAALEPEQLAPLHCGYRAEYIINAARAVSEGELDLSELADCGADEARERLMKIRGVGAKVANCAVLFGLGHMEAFPIDVWMKRALAEHFPPDFRPESLGAYAGLAQQYIFYRARSEGRS